MEKLIFYPGLDPVDRNDLKTFIRQDEDIVFFYHNQKHVHWNFINKYKRDQCFAFLLFNYTDREKGVDLNRLNVFESKDFSHAEITEHKIILARNGKEDLSIDSLSPIANDYETTEFHLLILDIEDNDSVVAYYHDSNSMPYPRNAHPIQKTHPLKKRP